ncbi:hypothetical protein ABZ816_06395 [Actinosynnema sp. NPDC047251]|uniref:Uncharacterized protein n=1 Tax=Saccharothrix espanaensis (strain ATCC 51144 / DSM 44229 / JCM 9112 / NBRC 15066 / NRRL 15764) TaxID=1179773 RepID=K0JQH8_SACES|nr:hypothetical protein [Saccharothrix espanaensis]CCH27916.1 hypothetical protein BN6_05850 [Saccharothrix espanaensis DSM 44229]
MISHASVVPAQRSGDTGSEVAEVSAVERYKEMVGLAGAAVEKMRDQDRDRVRDLLARLAASQDRMAELIEQEKLTQVGVRLLWEAAVEALWEERWMQMKPVPEPDESVPARDQRDYLTAMDVAYQSLEDTLQKRGLLRRKSS